MNRVPEWIAAVVLIAAWLLSVLFMIHNIDQVEPTPAPVVTEGPSSCGSGEQPVRNDQGKEIGCIRDHN